VSEALITELLVAALQTTALLLAPSILTMLVVGIVTNILQTITQVRDTAVTFVPKVIAVGVVLVFTAPWGLQVMQGFWRQIMEVLSRAAL
jgi:flagellar biosynthetic protein FliQ